MERLVRGKEWKPFQCLPDRIGSCKAFHLLQPCVPKLCVPEVYGTRKPMSFLSAIPIC
ncbi:hypothetical protein JZ751_021536 [Albula glossodonta]|uniref:Uncharacterized protein n=1 Tax=Albula glossodonta TaxID=121402 RepID=A0A8T2NID4_9TELE|nr:hypothetical protein JZ751_021536 [Albula glossodonta]